MAEIAQRFIEPQLIRLAEQFPSVTVMGPRQAGKTTVVKRVFPDHEYVNLEAPDVRELATTDPRGFFAAHPGNIILDEIQRVPELLNYIQVFIDEDRKNGRFILTGSHQPRLAEGIAQSLAGRTGMLTMLPFALGELGDSSISRDEILLKGFMPAIHAQNLDQASYYESYFRTYVERDVRTMINISNLQNFETFLRLLAGRVGQIINLQSLSSDIGVSSTTLASWLAVLEASYIVFRLPPYFKNYGKRLTKSPKLYFYEPGLAAWLLGIERSNQVARDPLLGGLFENLVVVEALKARLNAGRMASLYFFRDSRGFEVDLLAARGQDLMPIEIKSAMTFTSSFTTNLVKFMKMAPQASNPTVIYSGDTSQKISGINLARFDALYDSVIRWDERDE